ncbi:WDR17, partial [Symbiodinium sp. KB8]
AAAAKDVLERYQVISEFFVNVEGLQDFWHLLRVCAEQKGIVRAAESSSVEERKKEVAQGLWRGAPLLEEPLDLLHITENVEDTKAKAREMESIRGQRFGGGLSAQRRKERLAKAAELYARVGDTRKYCEILIELGKWDQAIAIAPSVSMEYWRELCRRNAERLEEEQDHKAVDYFLASGGIHEAISFYESRGLFREAATVASGEVQGIYANFKATYTKQVEETKASSEAKDALGSVIQKMAETYSIRAQP